LRNFPKKALPSTPGDPHFIRSETCERPAHVVGPVVEGGRRRTLATARQAATRVGGSELAALKIALHRP
jgi:hypothetical protein